MSHKLLFLALALVACSDATGPSGDESVGLAAVDPGNAAVKANWPDACAIPNHMDSEQCRLALLAIGVIAPQWYAACRGLKWAQCISSAAALAGALWGFDQGIDQHGHRSPFDDIGLRTVWPDDDEYNEGLPLRDGGGGGWLQR